MRGRTCQELEQAVVSTFEASRLEAKHIAHVRKSTSTRIEISTYAHIDKRLLDIMENTSCIF